VLRCGDRVFAESADIVAFADSRGAGLSSSDPDVRALEDDLDERLGPHGRRWMYDCLRGESALVERYGPTGVPAWQRRLVPLGFPLVARVIDRYLDITPDSAAESLAEVRAVYDEVGGRLADGRPYLMGDSFTAADLTFAALASPVLLPERGIAAYPAVDELPATMREHVERLRDSKAGRFALRMYAQERWRKAGDAV
jgi:glutathione S-transferase